MHFNSFKEELLDVTVTFAENYKGQKQFGKLFSDKGNVH